MGGPRRPVTINCVTAFIGSFGIHLVWLACRGRTVAAMALAEIHTTEWGLEFSVHGAQRALFQAARPCADLWKPDRRSPLTGTRSRSADSGLRQNKQYAAEMMH